MSPDAQDVSSRNIDQKKDSRDQADRAEGFFRNPFLQSSDHGQGSIDQKDARESKQEDGTKTDVSVAHFESVTAAIEAALAESGKDDVIAILGSLYQVRTVRDYFGRKTFEQ